MKKISILCLAILVSVVVFLADMTKKNELSHEDEIMIRKLHDTFEKTLMEADWDTLIEFYAEDAVRMRPNEPAVVGRESILSELKSFDTLSWEHRERPIKIIEGRDDLAFVWSIYKGEGNYEGNQFSNSGGFLQVFRKQKDGTWKVVLNIWSYDK